MREESPSLKPMFTTRSRFPLPGLLARSPHLENIGSSDTYLSSRVRFVTICVLHVWDVLQLDFIARAWSSYVGNLQYTAVEANPQKVRKKMSADADYMDKMTPKQA